MGEAAPTGEQIAELLELDQKRTPTGWDHACFIIAACNLAPTLAREVKHLRDKADHWPQWCSELQTKIRLIEAERDRLHHTVDGMEAWLTERSLVGIGTYIGNYIEGKRDQADLALTELRRLLTDGPAKEA